MAALAAMLGCSAAARPWIGLPHRTGNHVESTRVDHGQPFQLLRQEWHSHPCRRHVNQRSLHYVILPAAAVPASVRALRGTSLLQGFPPDTRDPAKGGARGQQFLLHPVRRPHRISQRIPQQAPSLFRSLQVVPAVPVLAKLLLSCSTLASPLRQLTFSRYGPVRCHEHSGRRDSHSRPDSLCSHLVLLAARLNGDAYSHAIDAPNVWICCRFLRNHARFVAAYPQAAARPARPRRRGMCGRRVSWRSDCLSSEGRVRLARPLSDWDRSGCTMGFWRRIACAAIVTGMAAKLIPTVGVVELWPVAKAWTQNVVGGRDIDAARRVAAKIRAGLGKYHVSQLNRNGVAPALSAALTGNPQLAEWLKCTAAIPSFGPSMRNGSYQKALNEAARQNVPNLAQIRFNQVAAPVMRALLVDVQRSIADHPQVAEAVPDFARFLSGAAPHRRPGRLAPGFELDPANRTHGDVGSVHGAPWRMTGRCGSFEAPSPHTGQPRRYGIPDEA